MIQRARFTESDVTRAIKGVLKAGLKPTRIEIDHRGRISIYCGSEDDMDDDLSKYIRPGSRA